MVHLCSPRPAFWISMTLRPISRRICCRHRSASLTSWHSVARYGRFCFGPRSSSVLAAKNLSRHPSHEACGAVCSGTDHVSPIMDTETAHPLTHKRPHMPSCLPKAGFERRVSQSILAILERFLAANPSMPTMNVCQRAGLSNFSCALQAVEHMLRS